MVWSAWVGSLEIFRIWLLRGRGVREGYMVWGWGGGLLKYRFTARSGSVEEVWKVQFCAEQWKIEGGGFWGVWRGGCGVGVGVLRMKVLREASMASCGMVVDGLRWLRWGGV